MSYSDSSSIFSVSTFASSSTEPGLGYHSGSAIRRLGSIVINGMSAITTRSRSASIEGSSVFTASSSDFTTLDSSSSIFTTTGTFTSSSTIPGLGYLSGKALHQVGFLILEGVIDPIVVRMRFAQIEAALIRSQTVSSSSARKDLFRDLLELSRPVYSQSIQERAFRMITGQIWGLEFEELADVIVEADISEVNHLLKEILSCLELQK
ncbi:hypothetical protein GYMLUDRAFT_934180 [Collybiopsis luxurians FD-317 M1]|nr:hypothetical protein GYMLUDRAFT_934180 [Collybiopsis luxurians FD-317 M1]